MESTYDPETHSLKLANVTPDTMASVEWPAGLETLIVAGDYLDTLVIPEGVDFVSCESLGLRNIVVPDSLLSLYCARNCLRSLELPSGLERLDASHNCLYDLSFRPPGPVALFCLDLEDVKLPSLDLKVNPDCSIVLGRVKHNMTLSAEVKFAIKNEPVLLAKRGSETIKE